MRFNSPHWKNFAISDSRLAYHRERLSSGAGGTEDFIALLESDSVVAVGTALDHYRQSESITRFGEENPFQIYELAVLDVARQTLSNPAYPPMESGAEEVGFNHASALWVIGDLGEPCDSHTVSEFVRSSASSAILSAALFAAAGILSASSAASDELMEALSYILFDESRSERTRLSALTALGEVRTVRVGDVISRMAESSNDHFQTEALALLIDHHMHSHGKLIEQVIAAWPQDVSRTKMHIRDAFHRKAQRGNGRGR